MIQNTLTMPQEVETKNQNYKIRENNAKTETATPLLKNGSVLRCVAPRGTGGISSFFRDKLRLATKDDKTMFYGNIIGSSLAHTGDQSPYVYSLNPRSNKFIDSSNPSDDLKKMHFFERRRETTSAEVNQFLGDFKNIDKMKPPSFRVETNPSLCHTIPEISSKTETVENEQNEFPKCYQMSNRSLASEDMKSYAAPKPTVERQSLAEYNKVQASNFGSSFQLESTCNRNVLEGREALLQKSISFKTSCQKSNATIADSSGLSRSCSFKINRKPGVYNGNQSERYAAPKPRVDSRSSSDHEKMPLPIHSSSFQSASTLEKNIPEGRRALLQKSISYKAPCHKSSATLPDRSSFCRSSSFKMNPKPYVDANHVRGTSISSDSFSYRKERPSSFDTHSVMTKSTENVTGTRAERLLDIEILYQESQNFKRRALVKATEGQWKEVYNLLLNALHLESEMEEFQHNLYNPLDVAHTLYHLGVALNWLGRVELALDALYESLNLRRKKLGDDHLDVALTLVYIGRVEGGKGDYKSAISNLRSAQNIYHRAFGSYDAATSRLINGYQHALVKKNNRANAA